MFINLRQKEEKRTEKRKERKDGKKQFILLSLLGACS